MLIFLPPNIGFPPARPISPTPWILITPSDVVYVFIRTALHHDIRLNLPPSFSDSPRPLQNGGATIPGTPQCQVLGYGQIPDNHYGLPTGLEIDRQDHRKMHKFPLTEEELAAGHTRLMQLRELLSRFSGVDFFIVQEDADSPAS